MNAIDAYKVESLRQAVKKESFPDIGMNVKKFFFLFSIKQLHGWQTYKRQ